MIRKVRKSSNRPRVPALLVTQLRKPADIEDARDSGVDAISLQPFAPCHLVDRLKTITARKREFIKTEWFVGPDRRAGREMRGNFKRNEDVNAGLIDETQALKNQAQSIIFDSLRRRDIFSARIGRSLEQFSKSLANVDRRAMETIHLHRAALANLASLPKSDVQTRVSVVTGLEQIAAR
jgi:DNA-binding response OmpR family regulator